MSIHESIIDPGVEVCLPRKARSDSRHCGNVYSTSKMNIHPLINQRFSYIETLDIDDSPSENLHVRGFKIG